MVRAYIITMCIQLAWLVSARILETQYLWYQWYGQGENKGGMNGREVTLISIQAKPGQDNLSMEESDDTGLQIQDSKFEPSWWSEAGHVTSQSHKRSTILNYKEREKQIMP